MTEQENQPLDGYGFRVGAELHVLSDRAIQPFDAAAIARAVAAERPRRIHLLPVGSRWRGRGRWPLLVIIVLASTLLALGAGVGQGPSIPATFAPGSIAFARDGDLYVAAHDGSRPIRMADGRSSATGISKFAFSPDRTYLAFAQVTDPASGAETLHLASADGTITHVYTPGVEPNTPASGSELTFGWAPDGTRLAVYPGATPGEIAIIGADGSSLGVLMLPSGVSMSVSTEFWSYFASLAWSPDSAWLAVAVRSGGELSPCIAGNDAETCYIMLATDGSGAQGSSAESSDYLAWAPDSRVAIVHWPYSVEIRPPDRSAPRVIRLPRVRHIYDGHILAWSPDGTRLVVASNGGLEWPGRANLVLIDGDGTVHPRLIDDPAAPMIDAVAWSMDGQRLLFQGVPTDSAESAIWSIDVGGGTPALITASDGSIFDIADGRP